MEPIINANLTGIVSEFNAEYLNSLKVNLAIVNNAPVKYLVWGCYFCITALVEAGVNQNLVSGTIYCC